MTDRRLIDAHMRTSYDRGARTGAAVARLGRTVGYGDEFVENAVDLVLSAQADQAAATWAYLTDAVEMADNAGRILAADPPIDAIIGAATHDGTPLETVYRRPGKLLAELSAADVPDAAARVSAMAEELATVDVAVAGRKAEAVYGRLDRRVTHWRRVPNAGACEFCRLIAQQTYTVKRLAPAHASCKCGTAPVVEQLPAGEDPLDRDELKRLDREGISVDTHAGPDVKAADVIPDEVVDTPAARGLPKGAKFADEDPYVVELAARAGVSPDELKAAVGRVPAVRQQLRDAAAVAQERHAGQLYQWNGEKVRGPGYYKARRQELPAEYDWFRGLDNREKSRLSRKWFDSSDASSAPDVYAAELRSVDDALGALDDEDVIAEWLRVNREYDALGAMRRGKLPSSRAYSGEVDLDAIITDFDYNATTILGNSDLEAAAHIAARDKDLVVQEALDYLGDAATAPRHGPSPYKMSYQSWEEEVRELDYWLREAPGDAPANAKERLLELVPEYLDDGEDYEDLYAKIIDTAHRAGEEVPEHARIPWR